MALFENVGVYLNPIFQTRDSPWTAFPLRNLRRGQRLLTNWLSIPFFVDAEAVSKVVTVTISLVCYLMC